MTPEDNPRVFVPPPLMLGAFVALGLLIDHDPRATGATLIVAITLSFVGIGLITAALGFIPSPKDETRALARCKLVGRRGSLRCTRNPMYLGMTLVGLAVALAFASVPATVLTLLAALIVDRAVIRREEAYLQRRFGADFDAYRQQVRRWL